jgi:hypothetical protein
MGGIGSGRQASFGLMVDKCHEMQSIDLAWLRRQNLMNVGRSASLRWSRGGNPTGSISIQFHWDHVRLVYRCRPSGGEWQDVNERIDLVETTTRFGGRRQWFGCPSCGRRCRILYGGSYFRCRKCHGLKYETQYEPPFARAATRALKIRERLGGDGGIDDPFPPKPKGMHQSTYDRLQAEEERLQREWAVGIASRFRSGGGAGGDG